jgi:hypothetical protein
MQRLATEKLLARIKESIGPSICFCVFFTVGLETGTTNYNNYTDCNYLEAQGATIMLTSRVRASSRRAVLQLEIPQSV